MNVGLEEVSLKKKIEGMESICTKIDKTFRTINVGAKIQDWCPLNTYKGTEEEQDPNNCFMRIGPNFGEYDSMKFWREKDKEQ